MLNKFLSISLLLISTFLISGCSVFGFQIPFTGSTTGPVNNNTTPITLTYWSLFEPYEIYQPLIEEYQQLNPNITIKFEQRSFDSLFTYKDSLLATLQSGVGAPDIIRLHVNWLPIYKKSLSPVPSSILSFDEYSADFYNTAVESTILDGKIYAVPLMFDSLALFYNKDIFSQKNMNPPTTWSDFLELSKNLTISDQKTFTQAGAAFGSAENISNFSDILGLLMHQSDISLPKDFTSPAFKDIVLFYTNFVKEAGVWDRNQAYSPLAFSQGRSAMIFGTSWMLLDILQNNPNLNVGVAPVPQVVGESQLTESNYSSYWVESVTNASKNKEESWKFIKWLSEPEQLRKAYSKASDTRAFGEPYPRVSMQSELVSNPYLAPFFVHAQNSTTLPISDRVGNDDYVAIFKNIVEGTLNGGDVDSLLNTAQKEYERLEKFVPAN